MNLVTRRLAASLILLVCIVSFSFAQSDPASAPVDFTGTWVMDKSKSGPERVGGWDVYIDKTMVIRQSADAFRIEEILIEKGNKRSFLREFVADGRKNPLYNKIDKDNYVSYGWKDRKLIKTASFVRGMGEGVDDILRRLNRSSVVFKNKEEWSLSRNGAVLTIRTKGGTAPNLPDPGTFIYVYNLQK